MSLREQLILKDGKARPPALLRKCCVHNGSAELPMRLRGDMAFEIDFVLGRQEEFYTCIQCGHTVPASKMMYFYQEYIANGRALVLGRNINAG